MPTRADLEAAGPKCPRIVKRMKHPDRRCCAPMTYLAPSNSWRCSVASCAMEVKGVLMAEYTMHDDVGLAEAA